MLKRLLTSCVAAPHHHVSVTHASTFVVFPPPHAPRSACRYNTTLCCQERLPVRMVLRGDMPVRHAFDGDSGVCVVPLRLSLRNCLPQTASLSIEAGLTVQASQRDGARARKS